MDRKTLTIVLSVIIIAAFFLPYIGETSGYDFVRNAPKGDGWEYYLWLISPVAALLLLLGALNKDRYILSYGLLIWLPFLTQVFIFIRILMEAELPVKEVVKSMGYGFWIATAAAIFLAFARPRR